MSRWPVEAALDCRLVRTFTPGELVHSSVPGTSCCTPGLRIAVGDWCTPDLLPYPWRIAIPLADRQTSGLLLYPL